jgi:hypothetical protein
VPCRKPVVNVAPSPFQSGARRATLLACGRHDEGLIRDSGIVRTFI